MKTTVKVFCMVILAGAWYPIQTMAFTRADPGQGAVSWSQQMPRAPHRIYTGKELCREQWGIVMSQMATYGQLSFKEAQNIAAFLGASSKPCGDSWAAKNVLLAGYGAVTWNRDNDEGETTIDSLYAQHIFVRPSEHTLVQAELEFAKPLDPAGDLTFEGLEYLNLSFFPGNHVQVSLGKLLSDFNYSNLRLHPVWMNLAVTQPWAAGLVPRVTMGGKIGVHGKVDGAIIGGTLFGGNDSETKYLEAQQVFGGRAGAYLPARGLEFGVSMAETDLNGDQTVYGAYGIKRFTRAKLEGEFAATSDQTTYWLGVTVRPWQSRGGWLSRFSMVTRYQEISVDQEAGGDAHEADEDHAAGLRAASSAGGEEEEGEGHHSALPAADAKEWYFGVMYDHPTALERLHLRFQAGYVKGSGAASDGWRAQAAFHW